MKNDIDTLFTRDNFDSEMLYNELEQLDEGDRNKVLDAVLFMQKVNTRSVLIGSIALQHHIKIPRKITPDIDYICEDLAPVLAEALKSQLEVSPLMNGIGYQIKDTLLDILAADTIIHKYALRYSHEKKILGFTIPTVDAEMLFIMKHLLSREKDINDALLILKSRSMDAEKLEKIVNELFADKALDEQMKDELLLYAQYIDNF